MRQQDPKILLPSSGNEPGPFCSTDCSGIKPDVTCRPVTALCFFNFEAGRIQAECSCFRLRRLARFRERSPASHARPHTPNSRSPSMAGVSEIFLNASEFESADTLPTEMQLGLYPGDEP